MKRFVLLFIALFLCLQGYTQGIKNDTIDVKSLAKCNWGILFGFGTQASIYYPSSNYFETLPDQVFTFGLYYKNFYIAERGTQLDLEVKKDINIKNIGSREKGDELQLKNFNAFLGYTYHLNDKYSLDFYSGYLKSCISTDTDVLSSEGISSKHAVGMICGLKFSRYIKLFRFHYLEISLCNDYYFADYKSINTNLKNYYITYSLNVGYKFWFGKLLK